MALKVLCSGYLVRYPLGGLSWHHLQYLVGFQQLGYEVVFLEDWGWPNSCYDPSRLVMTSDPAYGLAYVRPLLERYGLGAAWCYLAEDGTAHGMSREQLEALCRECDVYVDLSHVNWIPELDLCRRRVLVDTDPVFTQIGSHGLGKSLSWYHCRFTYGENVHRADSSMPTAGERWLPTRQPVVSDLWRVEPGDPGAPLTTVMNWSSASEREYEGRVYGQKDREFRPFVDLPRRLGEPMELAVSAPSHVRERLAAGGWRLGDPRVVARTPWSYQDYLRASRGEFGVAKHAYVTTRCGWFSDRSAGYLASGRPVVVQDTGFSRFLPCEAGLLAYQTPAEADAGIRSLRQDYPAHCVAARRLVETFFDARAVLGALLEASL